MVKGNDDDGDDDNDDDDHDNDHDDGNDSNDDDDDDCAVFSTPNAEHVILPTSPHII